MEKTISLAVCVLGLALSSTAIAATHTTTVKKTDSVLSNGLYIGANVATGSSTLGSGVLSSKGSGFSGGFNFGYQKVYHNNMALALELDGQFLPDTKATDFFSKGTYLGSFLAVKLSYAFTHEFAAYAKIGSGSVQATGVNGTVGENAIMLAGGIMYNLHNNLVANAGVQHSVTSSNDFKSTVGLLGISYYFK